MVITGTLQTGHITHTETVGGSSNSATIIQEVLNHYQMNTVLIFPNFKNY